MADEDRFRDLLVECRPLIERYAAEAARRHRLSKEDAAELPGWILTRIIEGDYAVLRKFRGESSIGTYLHVVVMMLARDYRVQCYGRWRPSAAAKRLGLVGIRLESLVYRRGCSLSEAGEMLRTSGETMLSDGELARLLRLMPRRGPLRPHEVELDDVERGVPGDSATARADAELDAESLDAEWGAIATTLNRVLAKLDENDRLVVRLYFWQDMSIADIARSLQLEQKPLYRRVERILRTLRIELEAAGIGDATLREVLAERRI